MFANSAHKSTHVMFWFAIMGVGLNTLYLKRLNENFMIVRSKG